MNLNDFGPGRLSAAWLNEEGTSENPWILETVSPDAEGHRDVLIGNGYIGQRIGIEGDASGYPSGGLNHPGCLIHGLWGERDLISPPRWATLTYHDGESTFARKVGQWRDYRQSLDLKTGIVSTRLNWENGQRCTHIESIAYVSRSRPNICFLSRTIRPEFDGIVSITDELNGSHLDILNGCRFTSDAKHDSPLSIELTTGPRNRRIVVLSRLVLAGIANPIVTCNQTKNAVTRTITFAVSTSQTYTVTKIVALVTDHDSPCPWTTACAYAEGAAFDLEKLRQEHTSSWDALWAHRIEVPHVRLQKIINASLYQFYCQLREGGKWSLGPTGLSDNYWGGHAFWDGDLWMFPVLALLNPALSKGFVDYRFNTLEGARRNALAEGYQGAMISWESAEFGDETIPHLIFHHQHHVNSDVALAQWWFWKITGDDNYLREKGVSVIVESAKFWASRTIYNKDLDRYEIRGICCADEFAEIQDNNAYTNYSAVKTLQLAISVLDFLGSKAPSQWSEIVAKMWIPFDSKNQRYIEYEGYSNQTIKQADTALLIYPYEMPMSDKVKANTVDFYRDRYPDANIMMAAAFDGIIDCELGRPDRAWESLCNLMTHFREPYMLASESPANETISFMTGLGGLLQLMVMGFAGIRIRENGLQVQPCLPKALTHLKILGMNYRGISFDLSLSNNRVSLENSSNVITFCVENSKGETWL